MKTWFTDILKGLVAHPDDLLIDEKTDELGILFTVSAHNDDIGVLIGRKGEHVNALRCLLRVRGHLDDMKVSLKINSPE